MTATTDTGLQTDFTHGSDSSLSARIDRYDEKGDLVRSVDLPEKWAIHAAKKILKGAEGKVGEHADEVAAARDRRNQARRKAH